MESQHGEENGGRGAGGSSPVEECDRYEEQLHGGWDGERKEEFRKGGKPLQGGVGAHSVCSLGSTEGLLTGKGWEYRC